MSKYAHRSPDPVRKQSPSMTKPGQALIPAELLKRQLAGTLPDIQHKPLFTHDENGKVISEDLNKHELHELFELSNQIREEEKRREKEDHDGRNERFKQRIIEEYKSSLVPPPKEGGDA